MSLAESKCDYSIATRQPLETLLKEPGYPEWVSAFTHGEEPPATIDTSGNPFTFPSDATVRITLESVHPDLPSEYVKRVVELGESERCEWSKPQLTNAANSRLDGNFSFNPKLGLRYYDDQLERYSRTKLLSPTEDSDFRKGPLIKDKYDNVGLGQVFQLSCKRPGCTDTVFRAGQKPVHFKNRWAHALTNDLNFSLEPMSQFTTECVGCPIPLTAGDKIMMILDGESPAHLRWDVNGEADPCRKAAKEERAYVMQQETEANSAGDEEGSLV